MLLTVSVVTDGIASLPLMNERRAMEVRTRDLFNLHPRRRHGISWALLAWTPVW